MQSLEITQNSLGELVLHKDKGDQTIITKDLMEYIWQTMEIQKIKEHLLSQEEINEDPSLIEDIDMLTLYYLEERNSIVNSLHKEILRLSIVDLDYDNADEEDEMEMNTEMSDDFLSHLLG